MKQAVETVKNIDAINRVVSASCGQGQIKGHGPVGQTNNAKPQSPATVPTNPNRPDDKPRSSKGRFISADKAAISMRTTIPKNT